VTFQQIHHQSDRKIDSEIVEYIQKEKVAWIARESGGDILVNCWFKETPTGTPVIHSVSSPTFDDPGRRASSYENNEKELANMKKMMGES